MSNRQQVLPGFSFTDDAYFDNFYITEDVRLLVNSLQQLVTDNAEDFVKVTNGCMRSLHKRALEIEIKIKRIEW